MLAHTESWACMGMCWRVSGTFACIYTEVSACSVYLRSSWIEGRTSFCMCELLSRGGHVFACVGAFQLDTDVFSLIFTCWKLSVPNKSLVLKYSAPWKKVKMYLMPRTWGQFFDAKVDLCSNELDPFRVYQLCDPLTAMSSFVTA
jgi:hypothetical protein